jgi:hypothetical protein
MSFFPIRNSIIFGRKISKCFLIEQIFVASVQVGCISNCRIMQKSITFAKKTLNNIIYDKRRIFGASSQSLRRVRSTKRKG